MAYVSSNPPQLLVPSIGAMPALWAYKSTNLSTDTIASGFYSNGSNLGMKVGDLVLVVNSTSAVPYLSAVLSVAASSAATTVASTAT